MSFWKGESCASLHQKGAGKSPRLSRHDSLQSGQLCSGGAVNAELVSLFTSQTKWIRGPTKKLGSKLIPFSKIWLYGILFMAHAIAISNNFSCIFVSKLVISSLAEHCVRTTIPSLEHWWRWRNLAYWSYLAAFFCVKHVGKHNHRSMIDQSFTFKLLVSDAHR